VAVISGLAMGSSSAGELAEGLGLQVERVRYLVKRLQEDGVVSVHGRRPRRGTAENVYAVDIRRSAEFEADLVARSPERRRTYMEASIRLILREVLKAIQVGAFGAEREHGISRIPLILDAQGVKEINAVFDAAFEGLLAISEASVKRARVSGEALVETRSAFVCVGRPA
jgi:DNA-binding Lrp family transcriptional regulator